MRQQKVDRVFIYDPNWINPYGLELASILVGCGYDVLLWSTENRKQAPPGVKLASTLVTARGSGSRRLATVILKRLFDPLVVAFFAPRRNPLILIWTRDPWDAFVFALRALLGGRTLFIYHNPSTVRPRLGLSGRMEQLLLKVTTTCVVHSQRLAAATRTRRTVVAAHPPYDFTTSQAEVATAPSTNKSSTPVIAFVGALRVDKGVDEFLEIAQHVNKKWILRILGPDQLPNPIAEELQRFGVTCQYVGSGTSPTDAELIAGLKSADLMIAPYRSVTESGSIHMALSLRVPVLAYDSPGVAHIVNSKSSAPSARQFGELLARYMESPWPTFTARADNLHAQCTKDWREILAGTA